MAEKQTNKDRMREIVDSIENGIKELFESDKYRKYLATMSRFHRYSVNNTMLIYMQRPDATHVAGFNKWRDQFGRNVLKGEKGIRIIAPTPYKKKVEEIKTDPETNAPVLDADGKAIIEEKEIRIPMFKVVSVFDVSQTSGKPLPQLAADLSGNVQQYEVFMEALRRASPVPMEIKPVARDTDGFFSIKAQSITIRAGMSEVQTVCAAVHEIAHAKLHDYEHMTELADDGETILVPGEKSRNTEEVEAESISYAVCQYYGIETGENSFGYIATWSKGKELKELRASLETINKTASELITDIDRHFAEICKERGIDRENLAAAEQPSVEAPEAEKLYMVDNDKYIHVQRSDTGIDYTIYDAGSAKVLDGGVLDGTEQQLSTAALEVCKLHNIGGAAPIRLAPLENFNLSHVPVYIMSEEQLGMYATYMSTLGNRPDLFPSSGYIGKYVEGSYTDYDIPPEALDDEVFAAIIKEAEKYLGYPYVWGGSSPSTSFDCSGFVSWVINHSGWDVGRLGAQGLCNICTPVSSANVKPGDLVFFTGTYDTPGVSHVGIYVGNNMMIHCGDPISYANLNSNYWQSHFYRYGRLP